MRRSRLRSRLLLWAAAVATTICVAVLATVVLTPHLEPIPDELITPVMPIITEEPSDIR